jgi:hypothetical protein
MNTNPSKSLEFIRALCKGKSEAEILEAHERFQRYIALVIRICERLEREETEQQELDTSSGIWDN